MATRGHYAIKRWNRASWQAIQTLAGGGGTVHAGALSRHGRRLAALDGEQDAQGDNTPGRVVV
jgi:hypothetical protein